MKVTLLQNVVGLGAVGDEVNVKDGYALNYLFPHKLAATLGSSLAKNVYAAKERELKNSAKKLEELQNTATRLNGKDFTVNVKSGANGKIYGSVTKNDLAKLIGIDKNNIVLANPIKLAGSYKVVIDFGRGITATVTAVIAAK